MPRISLWQPKKSNDYRFFDRQVSEMFTVGGTDILVHKYLGAPTDDTPTTDATQPHYTNQSEKNIQDLLFIENRDRKYDTNIYTVRGIYRIADSGFDLSQFGIFLQSDSLFMVFHINDIQDILGRPLIDGDVLELLHLRDFYSNTGLPVALDRFYSVSDCSRAAEGYSATWYPHLWRCKLTPLVDSQEYKDILNQIKEGTDTPIKDLISTYDNYININDAVIAQAESEVPRSGYDTSWIYTKPVNPDGSPADATGLTADDESLITAGSDTITADKSIVTPSSSIEGYLTGDGLAPNGFPVLHDIAFPAEPATGDFVLRVDYVPNRLFRFDGKRWAKVEDVNRSNLTPGAEDNHTLRNSFINNNNTYTDNNGVTQPESQGLSQVLRLKADN
jgi:hypothetical protein